MTIEEDKRYSKEYLEADKRSIANSLQIYFADGSSSEKVEVEFPIGHRSRRDEGIPILLSKFEKNLSTHYDKNQVKKIIDVCSDEEELHKTNVVDFIDLFVTD